MPTARELFFQNRLAMASVLLFRAVQVVRKLPRTPEIQGLLVEAEEFFVETKEELAKFANAPPEKSDSKIGIQRDSQPPIWREPTQVSPINYNPPTLEKETQAPQTFAQRLKQLYTKGPNSFPPQP